MEQYEGTTSLASNMIYAYGSGEDGNYGETVYGRFMSHVVENSEDTTTLTVNDNSGNKIFGTVSRTDGFGRVVCKNVSAGNLGIRQDFGYITNGENTGNLVTDYEVSYLKGTQKNYLEYGYTYDANGNIVCREEYSVASDGTETLIEKITYVYSGTILISSQSSLDGNVTYTNDNMGNPTKIQNDSTTYTLTWGQGRMLTGVAEDTNNSVTYSYNVDGLRTKKVVKENGVSTVTEYVWGNNGLAGMKTVIVLYDVDGQPVGFSLDGAIFHYVKNLQGDVVRILDESGNTVVEYSYDPWGVPSITGNTELAKVNPCSYRGYDYDEETGYYYLQTRYYDPEIGRFISVDAPETLVLSNNIAATNLYTYCYNNPVNFEDPSGFIAANVIGAVIGLVIGVVGRTFLGNWLADKLNLTGWKRNIFVAGIAALTGAASATIGNFIGPYVAKIAGTFGKYVVKLVKAGKIRVGKLSSNLKKSITGLFKETCCFVKGTQISTLYGYIAIEEIEVGDYVWSTNIETGEIGFKKVVEVFVRETNLLCYIRTNENEIISTNEHPFWVVGYGWSEASELKKGDVLQTQDGNTVIVLECHNEYVNEPITVYNFEVEDWHTYYVGTDQILVHNKCNLVKVSDKYLKNKGLDAHAIKREFLGNKASIKEYDLYYNKEDKVIFILRKGAKESQSIATYYILE